MKRRPRPGPELFGADPVPASAAIAEVLALRGITDEVRARRVVTEWAELVGPRIAQRTRPTGVTDRTLWVEVATSAWLHELNLLRPQLLASLTLALRDRLGEAPPFDDLKLRLAGGSRRAEVQLRPAAAPPPPPRPSRPPAAGAARERIVREASSVDDDELRALIARIRIAHDR